MGLLLFVNWQTMHLGFRALMWLLAIGLAIVILTQIPPSRPSEPTPTPHSNLSLVGGARGRR
jgi:hypothetical protein